MALIHDLGNQGEALALTYLERQGLTLHKKNYRSKLGEIDLIMQDKEYAVFVEVRYRSQTSYGGSIHSISKAKQRRIINTAKLWLLEKQLYDKVDCRFDVVALDYDNDGKLCTTWLPNAFQA